MNIVVTGVAGFIGSHLAEAIMKRGDFVIGIDNFHEFYSEDIKIKNILEIVDKIELLPEILNASTKEKKILKLLSSLDNKNLALKYCDLKNLDELDRIFDEYNVDMVVNLAGLAGVRPSLEQPIEYQRVNIEGYLNLLEYCKKYGVKKFIQASSSSVYGNNKEVPFKETDIVDFAISPYASTKKSCEVFGHTYYSLYNIDSIQLRFFTVYGPRQRPDLAIHKFTDKIYKGEPIAFFGDGDTFRDYTYIDDIIDGVIKSIDYLKENNGVYEIINIGESNTISLSNLVSTIEESLGKKAIINKLPMQPGDVKRTFADISKAKRVLGYNPTTDFKDGIDRFVKWYLGGK